MNENMTTNDKMAITFNGMDFREDKYHLMGTVVIGNHYVDCKTEDELWHTEKKEYVKVPMEICSAKSDEGNWIRFIYYPDSSEWDLMEGFQEDEGIFNTPQNGRQYPLEEKW